LSTTESSSNYQHLERMSVQELLHNINREDQTVPLAIAKVIDRIEAIVDVIVDRMGKGGRLF
jgi:N-acetylmuramic acid 6-phosphate etherase